MRVRPHPSRTYRFLVLYPYPLLGFREQKEKPCNCGEAGSSRKPGEEEEETRKRPQAKLSGHREPGKLQGLDRGEGRKYRSSLYRWENTLRRSVGLQSSLAGECGARWGLRRLRSTLRGDARGPGQGRGHLTQGSDAGRLGWNSVPPRPGAGCSVHLSRCFPSTQLHTEVYPGGGWTCLYGPFNTGEKT